MARARKPILSEEAKDFAILCFARFMSPTQVCEAIKDRFGIGVERNHIQTYDPTSVKGRTCLGKKRKAMFELTRERFLKELEDIPIANRAVRLHQLQIAFDGALEKRNVGMAMKLLEQAAKEAGNFHSNEKHVHHSGKIAVEEVSEDEMRNALAAALADELEKRQPQVDQAPRTLQ